MKPLHELVAKDKQHLPYIKPETSAKAKMNVRGIGAGRHWILKSLNDGTVISLRFILPLSQWHNKVPR